MEQNGVIPFADAVWDSVGTTLTSKGNVDRQPRTAAAWQEVRKNAINLIEAINLLVMDGRRMVPAGGRILDEGNEGVVTAEEGQKLLESKHPTFVQLAGAFRRGTPSGKQLKAGSTST